MRQWLVGFCWERPAEQGVQVRSSVYACSPTDSSLNAELSEMTVESCPSKACAI